MSFTEKIDVLDLLINLLRGHEEKLSELVERLEVAVNTAEDASSYPDDADVIEAIKTATEKYKQERDASMRRFYE